MATSVRLEGVDRLVKTLGAASKRMAKLAPVNREAAELVAEVARARAPRKSGALARSIEVGRVTDKTATIGSDVIYAGVQEWGWPAHNIRAHRFLQGAAEDTDVTPVYAEYVNGVIASIRGA